MFPNIENWKNPSVCFLLWFGSAAHSYSLHFFRTLLQWLRAVLNEARVLLRSFFLERDGIRGLRWDMDAAHSDVNHALLFGFYSFVRDKAINVRENPNRNKGGWPGRAVFEENWEGCFCNVKSEASPIGLDSLSYEKHVCSGLWLLHQP